MKFIIRLFIFLFAFLLLGSCSYKFSLQKRKYTKGFYFNVAKECKSKKCTDASANDASKSEEVSKPVDEEAVDVSAIPQNTVQIPEPSVEKPSNNQSHLFNNGQSSDFVNALKKANSETRASNNEKGQQLNKTKREGLFEIIAKIYIAYLIICLVVIVTVGLWYLFTYYPITVALTTLGEIVLVCAVLYLIGSAFARLFRIF